MFSHIFRTSLIAGAIVLATGFTQAFSAPFDHIDRAGDTPLSSFEKIYIAPVTTALDTETRPNLRDIDSPRPVTPDDQARRSEKLQRTLTKSFKRKFTLADAPGDGVLTIQAVLTKLESTRPTLGDQALARRLSQSSIYAGGAAFKVYIQDGDTLLATIEDEFETSLNDGRPRTGVWQDADRAFRNFSNKLSRYIREN